MQTNNAAADLDLFALLNEANAEYEAAVPAMVAADVALANELSLLAASYYGRMVAFNLRRSTDLLKCSEMSEHGRRERNVRYSRFD